MEQKIHTKWDYPLCKAVGLMIFTDRMLNPGKDTTKALVAEIVEQLGFPMTPDARKIIWQIAQDQHQSQVIEGRALKGPQALQPEKV